MIQDARELGKSKSADDSLLKIEVAQMGEDPLAPPGSLREAARVTRTFPSAGVVGA